MRAFAEIVADIKGALRQDVTASGTAGELGDRTGTLTTTRPELESLLALVVDIGADDVGRKQVRGALHTRELALERARQRPGERGLADAGVTLDKRMALGQQRDEQVPERLRPDLTARKTFSASRRAIAANASDSCGANGACSGPFPPLMSLAGARPRPAPLGRPAPCRFARLLAGCRRRRGSSPRCRSPQTRSRAWRCR